MKEHTITVYGTIAKTYRIEAENETDAEGVACDKFNEDYAEAVIDAWEVYEPILKE